ncbi:MAG: acylneuraminate cytidylyltransferase family protein [Balneolaceae bacterium]|nr:acylneuraminate cytidylyltransferase family protein [Balneolaceae bacterium]MBO6546931.1 acylneuraminate cytidylyltransferase family protein [Balneolaceae bacterium]MBO6649291.1 acylneuraminate cytidylyltransferase family protein [Balneolaceae bacterium]
MSKPKITALLFMKGYSERVPGKNLREFHGKPLLYWILESLKQSNSISSILINTDSEEIAETALKYFDVKIHMRPDYLLTITSNEANQIIEYDINKTDADFYLQTHSTNPLLTAKTIDKSIDRFLNQDIHDSLMSVTSMQSRFYWPDGKGINHNPKKLIKTQDLSPVYEENSCIYMFSRSMFMEKKNRIGDNPLLFPINRVEAVDIDEESDFQIAESIKRYLSEREI